MPQQQCVSNVFENNSGLLEVQDCTDGTDWPYACDIDLYQGLRVDTRGCIYAEPRPFAVVDRVEANAFFNATATMDDPQQITILEFDIVNPDPCRVMTFHVVPLFGWDLSPTANSEFLLSKKITGDFPESDTDFVNIWQSQSPSTRPKTITSQAQSLLLTLDPGATLHLVVEQQTRSINANNVGVNHYNFQAAWIGVT